MISVLRPMVKNSDINYTSLGPAQCDLFPPPRLEVLLHATKKNSPQVLGRAASCEEKK